MAESPMVLIVAIPAGEAPQKVSECWVGLELPLARRNLVVAKTFGVVSGPRTKLGSILAAMLGRERDLRGYSVRSAEASTILRAAHPEAGHGGSSTRLSIFALDDASCSKRSNASPSPRAAPHHVPSFVSARLPFARPEGPDAGGAERGAPTDVRYLRPCK